DRVSSFRLLVAGEAGLHHRLIGRRFAVLEMTESPPTGRGVLFLVLDHELNVRGGAGYERLVTTKDLVVFLGRNVTIVQSGNDCALRKRELPVAVSLDRDIVAQNGSKTVKVAIFMGHRDQPPVAVSGGDLGYEDRRGLLGRGVSRGPRREGNDAGQSCNCSQQECESFHRDASYTGTGARRSARASASQRAGTWWSGAGMALFGRAQVAECQPTDQAPVSVAALSERFVGRVGARCRASFFHRREDGSPLGLQ